MPRLSEQGVTTLYKQNYRIRTYDVDRNKILKPSGALQITQDAGCGQMRTEGMSYEEVFATGRAYMLNRLDMNILTEVHEDEDVTASSWPCESRRATFLRCYGMWRGEEPVVEISTQWSLVSLEDRKILTVEDADMTGYEYGPYKEAAPGKFKIPPAQAEAMICASQHRVSYSDADSNGHMNNTYYLNYLCDLIPELEAGTHRVSTLRIHYSKEAPVGETIAIYQSEKLPPREGADQESRYLFRTLRKSDGEMNIAAEIGIVPVKSAI